MNSEKTNRHRQSKETIRRQRTWEYRLGLFTCLGSSMDDSYSCSPENVLGHSEEILGLFKHRRRHWASHHAHVYPGIDRRRQTTAVLGWYHHGDDCVGFAMERARKRNNTCRGRQMKRESEFTLCIWFLNTPKQTHFAMPHLYLYVYVHLYSVCFGASIVTCVLVESKEGRASSRYRAVGHPAVFPGVRVIRCYLDDRGSRGTMGTETDCVEDWIEGRSVVIDVHHRDPHTGYWAQTALKQKILQIWLKMFAFKYNVSRVCKVASAEQARLRQWY